MGVLITLLAPGAGSPSTGFWVGVVLVAAAGFGWGARLRDWLVSASQGAPTPSARGFVRPAVGGAAVLLLTGLTALIGGLLLTALFAGAGATWGLVREALARPGALALPVLGVVLVGLPFGATAGTVLRLMSGAGDAPRNRRGDAPSGSPSGLLR